MEVKYRSSEDAIERSFDRGEDGVGVGVGGHGLETKGIRWWCKCTFYLCGDVSLNTTALFITSHPTTSGLT